MLDRVTRRPSDEVSLDIVMALLVGTPVGIALAALVGFAGWLTGRAVGGLPVWVGLVAAALTTILVLSRSQRRVRA